MKSPLLAIFAFLFLGCFAKPAQADLHFCNDTGAYIWAAIGYVENGERVSEGWWDFESGECKRTKSGDLSFGAHYYQVNAHDREFPQGDTMFCVEDQPFTLVGGVHDVCGLFDVEPRLFNRFDVTYTNYVLHFTPDGIQGRIFLDNPEIVSFTQMMEWLEGSWFSPIPHKGGTEVLVVEGNRLVKVYLGNNDDREVIYDGTFKIDSTCNGHTSGGTEQLYIVTNRSTEPCWAIRELAPGRFVYRDPALGQFTILDPLEDN